MHIINIKIIKNENIQTQMGKNIVTTYYPQQKCCQLPGTPQAWWFNQVLRDFLNIKRDGSPSWHRVWKCAFLVIVSDFWNIISHKICMASKVISVGLYKALKTWFFIHYWDKTLNKPALKLFGKCSLENCSLVSVVFYVVFMLINYFLCAFNPM